MLKIRRCKPGVKRLVSRSIQDSRNSSRWLAFKCFVTACPMTMQTMTPFDPGLASLERHHAIVFSVLQISLSFRKIDDRTSMNV